MRKLHFVAAAALGAYSLFAMAQQVAVHVEPPHLDGPRQLEEQTQQAAVRDYLESWKSMQLALDQNQAGSLDRDFVGIAKDRLIGTINQQAAAGLHTRYQDRSHDIQFVFYSPEGLSIELTDTVDYDVSVFDKDKQVSTQQVHARYIVVMTPAEVRWRVRIFQNQAE
jgi:hypothetical protein